jgi:hypothetical protein
MARHGMIDHHRAERRRGRLGHPGNRFLAVGDGHDHPAGAGKDRRGQPLLRRFVVDQQYRARMITHAAQSVLQWHDYRPTA